MATEFPDDPEVDLGFRDPATENSIPESAEERKAQMELRLDYEPGVSKERLSNPWWSLRITIILFLSAFGGLISSIFLFDHAERPSILKRWKREAYIAPKTAEPLLVTANWDFRLDRLLSFQIEGDRSSFDGHPELFQESDASTFSIQQRPPFDAAFRLPLNAPRFVLPGDFSITQISGTAASERAGYEDATQTHNSIRTTAEKTRERQVPRIKRRVARRVARSAKSIASFWAIWSRHFFLSSGLASTSSNRRLAARKSLRRGNKPSLWFPLSWHAIAGRPIKKAIPAGAAIHSPRGGKYRFEPRESGSERSRAP